VQPEHRLGAFDHELSAITNQHRHCFALLSWASGESLLGSRNGADISGARPKCLQYSVYEFGPLGKAVASAAESPSAAALS
jgi:hypothetical protein